MSGLVTAKISLLQITTIEALGTIASGGNWTTANVSQIQLFKSPIISILYRLTKPIVFIDKP